MAILAIDFSAAHRSVAIVDAAGTRGHATELSPREGRVFGLIDTALAQAGLEREAIQTLAVGLGPGSYTGIRAVLALAQGWQLARPVTTLGFSSIDVLAEQLRREQRFGRATLVVGAQRGELYLATYEIIPDRSRCVTPLHLAALAEAQTCAARHDLLAGPEATRWFPDGLDLSPDARVLGRLAVGRTDFVPAAALEPIYLREAKFAKAPPPRVLPTQ